MKRLGRWWIFSVAFSLLVFSISLNANSQTHAIKHYGLDKNIFPSRIECLAQAQSGELLIGTLAGLVIYDGYSFDSYDVNDGLAESSISHIYVDGETIWLGHWTGSISKFDLSTGEVEVLAFADNFNYASIIKILSGSGDELIVLTKEGNLYTFNEKGVERMVLNVAENDDIIDVFHLHSRLHVITESKIIKRINTTGSERQWEVMYSTKKAPITAAMWWRENTWLIADENNVEVLDLSTGKQVLGHLVKPLGILGVQDITRDVTGRFWISTDNHGVFQIDILNHRVQQIDRRNGLSYNQVKSVFIDREGIIWIATSAGLDQYLGDAFKLYDARSGVVGNIVWDLEIFDMRVYACTSEGISIGALPANIDGLTIQHYVEAPDAEFKQIVFDGYDQLYVLDHAGSVWKMKTSELQLENTQAIDQEVNCIEIVNGELWLGTDEGIFVINSGNGRPIEHLSTETGLAGNRITGIYYSKLKNETWITALGSQTIRYKDSRFKRYGEDEGLQSTVIQDAAFDKDGNVWFASYDNGVFSYNNDAFHALSDKVSLTSETTFSIAIDERGAIWVGHNWGVDSYLPALEMHESYGEDEGFMGVEINPGAMVYHPSVGLWMGTLMGILGFDPERLKPNPFEPTLIIKKAMLGSVDLLDSTNHDDLLNVSSDLFVDFESISLVNPEKNTFFYRLSGAHENWRPLKEPGHVEYLSLPMGDFRFELKACNNSGVCRTSAANIDFTISPPIYRTWWFYTVLFLIVVVIIFFMDQYRVVSLLEEKSKIQEKLDFRNQKLLELDQENQRLIVQNKQNNKFIEALQTIDLEENNLAAEVLMGFHAFHLKLGTISSNGVFTHLKKQLKCVFFVEIGSTGPAAHAVRVELKLKVHQRFANVSSPEDGLNEWSIIVNSLEKSLPQFKGINWFVCFESGRSKKCASDGMILFNVSDGKIERMNHFGTNDAGSSEKYQLVELNQSEKHLVASGGFFEQLNEAGTKSFSPKMMGQIISKYHQQSPEVIARASFDAFDKWRGGMEQFQDVSIFIWQNEK